MFILTTIHSKHRNHLYDIDTLEDVVLGLTGDEDEAERIAAVAGNMRLGDVFSNSELYLKCVNEEKKYAN